MRKKISISYLGKLKNEKFPAAYASILRTMEGSVITEEYLTECLEVAKAKQDELGFLGNMRGKHPLTEVISELRKNRHYYLLSLRGSANNALRSPFEEERKAGKVLVAWLEKYHGYFSSPRIYEQTNLTNLLNEGMSNYENIYEAMSTLNLMRVFDSIVLITEEIGKTHKERIRDRNARSRYALMLRNNALAELKRLINALDLAITQESENSAIYINYWNDIASELDELNALAVSRRTRKKNAAEKEEQPEDNGVDDEKDDDAEGNMQPTRTTPRMTTAMRSTPYSTAGLNKGMDMDLQNGQPLNDSLTIDNDADDAMNGSGTFNNNDVATPTDGNKAQADDATTQNGTNGEATTGNGELTSSDPKPATVDDDTTGHSDANDQVANIE